MANITVQLVSKTPAPGGKIIPEYCGPADPGRRYRAAPCLDDEAAIEAAIQAHVDQRKAAGHDYAGKPATSPQTFTVLV